MNKLFNIIEAEKASREATQVSREVLRIQIQMGCRCGKCLQKLTLKHWQIALVVILVGLIVRSLV